MMSLLNYRLRVTMSDGRSLIGQLKAFDRHMNLVMADCEEFRKFKIKDSKEGERREREEKRTLGLLILRGETIVQFTIEAPPPTARHMDKRILAPGTGIARPAGRGTPIAAASIPVGLMGPTRIGPVGWKE